MAIDFAKGPLRCETAPSSRAEAAASALEQLVRLLAAQAARELIEAQGNLSSPEPGTLPSGGPEMTRRRGYCRAREIAELTGLSVRTVRRRIADGTLRSVKWGGARLVPELELADPQEPASWDIAGGENEFKVKDGESCGFGVFRESIIQILVPCMLVLLSRMSPFYTCCHLE